jgi:hypothetical protein
LLEIRQNSLTAKDGASLRPMPAVCNQKPDETAIFSGFPG